MADAIADAARLADEIALLLFERPSEVASALPLAQQLTNALSRAQAEVAADPDRWA